ncbi:MAG TPA: ATP-binding cassette domain-containing protein [Steroidobacteraceae bacterium]
MGATRYLEVRLAHVNLHRAGRYVLKDISWSIRPGQRGVLAGAVWPPPSPRATRHYLLGRELSRTPFEVKDEIAYLGAERQDRYQRYGWNMAVERIVGTGLYRTDIPLDALSALDRLRIRRALARLAVAHLASRRFLSLSYGERRVILLARALVSRPRLLLLDEVLNGLDEINRARVGRWLARQTGRLPCVLATHRMEDLPASATHASPAAHARRAARTDGRSLVRLINARVYLDQCCVLDGISLTVRAGEFWVIHGRNGSGKTTLLRTVYGDHGVAVGGMLERAGVGPGVPLEVSKKRVGLVAPHLQADHPPQLTVAEAVQSGRRASVGLNDAPGAADRSAARRYGQSRRVLFARAWVREPELLQLDEPFAGVDTATRHALVQRVLALAAGGTAVVVSAHRAGEWLGSASHELELARGRALYCGPIRSSPERSQALAGAAR